MTPTAASHIGTWTLKATFTPDNGSAITYTAISITVTCTVTSFTIGAGPSNLNYDVFGTSAFVDVSTVSLTQVPDCGYAYTTTYTWTGTVSNVITIDSGNGGRINVQTNNVSDANTYAVTVGRTIIIADNNGSSSSFDYTGSSDQHSFNVIISNPCPQATLNEITFAPTSISVQDGQSATATFSSPTTTIDVNNSLFQACGSLSFAVFADDQDTALSTQWATVSTTGATGTLTVDTSIDQTLIDNEASK